MVLFAASLCAPVLPVQGLHPPFMSRPRVAQSFLFSLGHSSTTLSPSPRLWNKKTLQVSENLWIFSASHLTNCFSEPLILPWKKKKVWGTREQIRYTDMHRLLLQPFPAIFNKLGLLYIDFQDTGNFKCPSAELRIPLIVSSKPCVQGSPLCLDDATASSLTNPN